MSNKSQLPISAGAISDGPARTPKPENTLILGWNPRALTIVSELDKYVAPGSMVTVVAEGVADRADLAAAAAACANQAVSLREGATTARGMLTSLPLETFDHVIVLSYSDTLPIQEADARTLMTLLHLRDLAQQHSYGFSIVSEMLDVRNRALAEVTQADDFIVSNKLVGLMLAQIAENKDLALVFADLFDADGAEIYLRPAREYVSLEQPVSFYTVLEAAARRGEIAIGYRLKRETTNAPTYGVHLNPAKSPAVTFEPGDRVIVIANG